MSTIGRKQIPQVRRSKIRSWNEVYQVVKDDIEAGRIRVEGASAKNARVYDSDEIDVFLKNIDGKLEAMSAQVNGLAKVVEQFANLKTGKK